MPELSFEKVSLSYTDYIIPVAQNADLSGYTVRWYISKDGGERKPYSEYSGDTLDEHGGDIRLTETGEYVLTLCAEDETGRVFEYSRHITVMPVADILFTLPAAAHTDTEVEIEAELVNIDTADVKWTITKDEQEKDYTEYAVGTLGSNGGSIKFKDEGGYTVTARFTDAFGRDYEKSKRIKVYSVPVVEYGDNGLPSYAYTDTDIEINPENTNLGSLDIVWYINDKPYTDYVTGTLDNNGGTVRFMSKGHYTLTVRITDETGREYAYSSETDILPVPTMNISLSAYTHTDEDAEFAVTSAELDGTDVIWQISKDGGEYQNYTVFAGGSLNNSGGKLRFKDKGEYIVKAVAVDCKGRIFEFASDKIKAYPVPVISVTMPQTTHTDESAEVTARLADADGLNISWSLAKDGGEAQSINSLTNDGGTLTFDEKGVYTLYYSVTDDTGTCI